MNFLIADTFTDSLSKLTNDEQKAAKVTVFDLQQDPRGPGLRWHKLDAMRDKRFASVSVNMDLRLIVHRTDASLLLCYIGHHDKAYRWARRRKLETHPRTGAAQLVEVRETVREVEVPVYVDTPTGAPTAPTPVPEDSEVGTSRAAEPLPALFAERPEEELLGYGVPADWLGAVREATEDTLLALADALPREAAEALLELATGGTPTPSAVAGVADVPADPFAHPDAQRRFRVMTDIEELQRALDFPWEKWTVFLHPAQRAIVEKRYNGPARVAGSAGTGKTVVALHRAVHLAHQEPEARVLVTTFSDTLAGALGVKLRRLVGNEPAVYERIDVEAVSAVGRRLYAAVIGRAEPAGNEVLDELLREASAGVEGHQFSESFIRAEWRGVVDAWQLGTWEAYRDVQRLGRKTRLGEAQRRLLWGIFERVRAGLAERGLRTEAAMQGELAVYYRGKDRGPYRYIVVDEAQDIGVAELRLLAALGSTSESPADALFFAGDLGQRIFQPPFSWRSLGVDVRGRSRTLRINYRTSHQIRRQADRLLPPELADVDGIAEVRRGTVSVFNSPEPAVEVFETAEAERARVAAWVGELLTEGYRPHEIGVFVRSKAELDRARAAVVSLDVESATLSAIEMAVPGRVALGTMHLAKGLEFRAVAVMACDEEVLPLQSRIEAVTDPADLDEVYTTERHLLYVACTRARDRLLVSGVEPVSEFLADLVLS